jgi:hypothetical protein
MDKREKMMREGFGRDLARWGVQVPEGASVQELEELHRGERQRQIEERKNQNAEKARARREREREIAAAEAPNNPLAARALALIDAGIFISRDCRERGEEYIFYWDENKIKDGERRLSRGETDAVLREQGTEIYRKKMESILDGYKSKFGERWREVLTNDANTSMDFKSAVYDEAAATLKFLELKS